MVDGSQDYPIWVACRGNPDLWRSGDPKLARANEQHNRAGVRLYLSCKPGAKALEVLPQVLTPAMLSALAGER